MITMIFPLRKSMCLFCLTGVVASQINLGQPSIKRDSLRQMDAGIDFRERK